MIDEGTVWEGWGIITPYVSPPQPILPRKIGKTISSADLKGPSLYDVIRQDYERTRVAQNYTPKKIIHNENAVIVFWPDNTKTIVRRKADDPDDVHSAFAQALVKKLFKGTTTAHKMVNRVLEEQTPKKRE